MRNKWIGLSVALVMLAGIVLSACGAPATPAPTAVPTKPAVATPKPIFAKLTLGIVYGAEDAALKAGIASMAKSLGADVLEATTGGDATKVSTELESFVSKGVHAVIVCASASEEWKPVLAKAKANGVKVVTVGAIPNAKVDVDVEVILDDYDLAFVSLKEVALAMGGIGKLGVIGSVGDKSFQLRSRVVRLMVDMYANIRTYEIGAATDDTKAISQKAFDAMNNALDTKAFWLTSAQFAAGVMDAVQRRDLKNVQIFAANSGITPGVVKLLAADNIFQSVAYSDHMEAGKIAVRAAASLGSNAKVQRYQYVLANLLTKADAKKVKDGEVPASATTEVCWNDAVWALYQKNDAAGATTAKAAVDAIKQSSIKSVALKLPDPATLPADFQARPLTFGMVRQRMNYQHNELLRSGQDEIAKMFNVKLLNSDADNDFSKMVSDMENFIAQGVDAIFVDHGTTASMEPVVKKAVAKGIKVVTFDCPQPNVPEVSSDTSQDDYGHAFLGLRAAISYVGGKGKLGVVWIGGSVPLENRVRVLRMMLESYPDIIPIEYGERSKNYPADVMAKTEAALAANPDIKAFWVTFDQMALGAHEALKQGKRTDLPIFSVDMSSEDLARMSEPGSPWVLTATSDPIEVGRVTLLTMVAAVYGQSTPHYIRIPAFSITQEQAKMLPAGTMPAPIPTGYGWTPFMVALKNKIAGQ